MKNYKQLTSGLRYQIYGLKQAGLNQTEIAEKVGVNKATISREFRRNKGKRAGDPNRHKLYAINVGWLVSMVANFRQASGRRLND